MSRPIETADSLCMPSDYQRVESVSPTVRGWKRWIMLSLAGLSLVTGIVGIFLPILPTTPFVLLSSFFLVRSSPRLNAALTSSRLFGPIIADWQQRGGVRRDIKLKAISMVVLAVVATIHLAQFSALPALTVTLLAAIGVGVILRLPTAD